MFHELQRSYDGSLLHYRKYDLLFYVIYYVRLGIQDKKRAKAADLKELLKHIIIACVAVSGLILAVIVLVHIYNSLFVKKQ